MKKADYTITSGFGPRGGAMHQGLDLAGTAGKPMFAAYDGVVDRAGSATGFGQWIVLRHNINGKRVDTVYGHMFEKDLLVKVGQKVTAGQEIAKVGYNGEVSPPGPGGAHLHFEVWEGGWGGTAVDPRPWLDGAHEPGSAAPRPQAPVRADATVVSVADWNKVAEHESNGNWKINTGNGYYGGLQFSASTWKAFGGDKYAPSADQATPQEQMEVANATLRGQGWDAWPVTSRQAGVRDKKPAPEGTFVNGAAPAPAKPERESRPAPDSPSTLGGVTDSGGELDISKPMPARMGSEANWQVNTVRLSRAVAARFPELQTIGGWRADGGGFSDHPDGRAADIMMPNSGRDPKNVDLGNRIQRYVMANKALFKVDYTIWRQYYQPAAGAGNVMEDRGDWTQNHFDHVHVTLLPSPRFSGQDLGAVQDKSGGTSGGTTTDSAECVPETTPGNNRVINVRAGSVPAAWARWYNQAGALCPQITPSLLAAQGHQETGGFQQHVQSPDAAKGPGQFIDSTWASYGKDYDRDGRIDVYSLGDAIMAQGHFMCDIAKQVDGWVSSGSVDPKSGPNRDVRDLYLAAYNAGPGSVQGSRGFPNQYSRHFTETRPYAEIIIANEPKYRGTLADAAT
ncbi:transglycosylase family protein [Gordonia sp. (in: high G+C Gram-positive bacteria)]|uniref:transglycosylase family protein n=1 Tax=Gordonia sp. (in: high G+C Gram-positive bacteria) TaxID=84139 RepID=UPI003C78E1A7